MLGIIAYDNRKEKVKQSFIHSKDVTYILGNNQLTLNENTLYVLHPALTKSIKKLKQSDILHFNGFIIGKENIVKKKDLDSLFDDKQNLKPNELKRKYYR